MCGICGTAGFGDIGTVRAMAGAMAHRGPDDEGTFESQDARIFLANRRLSIIDVEGGKQPIFSENKDIVAVQNGEIYNFRELRTELEKKGHTFRSRTDSEVIPHLYEEFGEEFPCHLDGMFAIALWDSDERKLILARDHMGIKPLYVWETGGSLAFASEVKAIIKSGLYKPALDFTALHFLMNIRFVPGERTLFSGIRTLRPGTLLAWQEGNVREERYWALDMEPDPSIRRADDCVEQVRHLLGSSVKKQLVSDVPLGLYLSGGIDSSALVATASSISDTRVNTFSLGFNEPTDELDDARIIADAFGTSHHETSINFDALSVFPDVIWHVEEPKENAIQLYLLSRYASQHVTVALSGLGGDELFGGYRIFDYIRPLVLPERFIGRSVNAGLLWPVRNLMGMLLGSMGSVRWDLAKRAIDGALSLGVPERWYPILRNMWEHDRRLFSTIYTDKARLLIEPRVEAFFAPMFAHPHRDIREDVLRAEIRYKMVDDFLLNEDKTSMANSLEVRVPFLDKELVQFAFSIPAGVKFTGGGLKVVLKEAMRDVLPDHALSKPKWGFTFDSYHQFQKDLRDLSIRELTPSFIEGQGIFRYEFIKSILDHPPHRWMRWHYFLLWLMLGIKIWQDLFLAGKKPEECCGN